MMRHDVLTKMLTYWERRRRTERMVRAAHRLRRARRPLVSARTPFCAAHTMLSPTQHENRPDNGLKRHTADAG